MILRKRGTEDSEALQFLYENSSCFFNRYEWLQVLQEGFKVPVWSYCLEGGGEIFLVLPGMIFNFGIIKMFYSNIPYGGFVGNYELITSSLSFFEESLRRDGVHLIRIGRNFNNKFQDLDEYRRRIVFTHLLNLEGVTEERLWKGYKKRVRRDIRKAEKFGIYVEGDSFHY